MKNRSLLIRTAVIIAITLIGIYLVIGPRKGGSPMSIFSWSGIQQNLRNNINLGLDLKGGTHLVMSVKTDDYLKKLTENSDQAALNAAKEANLPVADSSHVAQNGTYQVNLNLTDAAQADAVIEAVKKKVDFANWTETTAAETKISWSLPSQAQTTLKDQAVEQASERLSKAALTRSALKNRLLQRYGAKSSGSDSFTDARRG